MEKEVSKIYITYIEDEGDLLKIWGQSDRISGSYIDNTMTAISPKLFSSPEPRPSNLQPGTLCCVAYLIGSKKQYYRCQITKLISEQQALVFLIDYGNSEIRLIENLRPIEHHDNHVVKMAPQAKYYYLADIIGPSGGWSTKVLDHIRKQVCYEELHCHIFGGTPKNKLIRVSFNGSNYGLTLVNEGFAKLTDIENQNQILVHMEMQGKKQMMLQNFVKQDYSVPPPVHGSVPPGFPAKQGGSHPLMSVAEPTKYYSAQNQLAQITSGNLASKIPPSMNQYSYQLQQPGVDMSGASTSPMNILNNPNVIQALATQVKQQIALEQPVQTARLKQQEDAIPHTYISQELKSNSSYNVYVSYAEDGPWSFYVQLETDAEELNKLMEDLRTEQRKSIKKPVVIGQACLVHSKQYPDPSRGVIINLSNTAARVFFVDFGNTEDLPISEIYELPKKYFKTKILAYNFSLTDLDRVAKTEEMLEEFRKVVTDVSLALKIVQSPESVIQRCELYKHNRNIKLILNERMRRQKVLNYGPVELPGVGSTVPVYVTYVEAPGKFYVQLASKSDEIDKLMEHVSASSGQALLVAEELIRPGLPCCCMYSSDQQWYRAKVTTLSEDSCRVCFIDYGNEETVSLSKIKHLDNSLVTRLPPQGIKCVLHGFENNNVSDLASKLEAETVDKEITMIVKQANKDVLTVQLFCNGVDVGAGLVSPTPKQTVLASPPQAKPQPKLAEDEWQDDSSYPKTVPDRNLQGVGKNNSWRDRKSLPPRNNKQNNNHQRVAKNKKFNKRTQNQTDGDDINFNKPSDVKQSPSSDTWKQFNDRKSKFDNNDTGGYKGRRFDEPSDGGRKRFDNDSDRGGFKGRRKFDNEDGGRFKGRNSYGNADDGGFKGRRRNDNDSDGGSGFKGRKTLGDDSPPGFKSKNRFENNSDGGGGFKGRNKFDSEDRGGRKKFDNDGFKNRGGGGDSWDNNESKPPRQEPQDLAPAGSQYVERVIELGTSENVSVTYYFSPSEFYVQTKTQENEFRIMMENIQTAYAGRYCSKDGFQANDILVAKFSTDKILYRAQVTKSRPLTVRFVDYGNTDMCQFRGAWNIENKFLELPKQAVKCCLDVVKPAGDAWPICNESVDRLFEADPLQCTFNRLEDGVYYVSLLNVDNNEDVGDRLITDGFAAGSAPPVDVRTIDHTLLTGQVLYTVLVFVESVSKFFIQLVPSYVDVIQNQVADFMLKTEAVSLVDKDKLEVGSVCITTPDSSVWYRARVVHVGDECLEVQFVDFGDRAEVDHKQVYQLPEHLSAYQEQAVECTLAGDLTTLTDETHEQFRTDYEGQSVLLAVQNYNDNRLSVNVYDVTGASIELIKDLTEPKAIEAVPTLPVLTNVNRVQVSHVESPHIIYIQLVEDTDEITNLLNNMYAHYQENNVEFTGVEGSLCAARSVADENWYRARLMNKTDAGCNVSYVDYGNTEEVCSENLRELSPEFMAIHCKTVRTRLGVNIPDDEEVRGKIYDKINEFIAEKELTCYVVKKDKELWIELKDEEMRLSKVLVEDGLISDQDEDVFKSLIEQDQVKLSLVELTGEVYISHIDDVNNFWVHSSNIVDLLDQLQFQLQNAASDLKVQTNLQDNDYVAAMFEDDGQWYRAKVIDKTACLVQFIDYGNKSVINIETNPLKILTETLLKHPIYANPCSLGLESTQEQTEKLTEIAKTCEDPVKLNVLERVGDCFKVELFVNEQNLRELLVESVVSAPAPVGDKYYICHVVSLQEFYVRDRNVNLGEINDKLANADEWEVVHDVVVDDVYAGQRTKDNMWYRCRVTSVTDEGVNVLFVDYGDYDVLQTVKLLPQDVAELPPLALQCTLLLRNNDTWSEAASEKFVEIHGDGDKLYDIKFVKCGKVNNVEVKTEDGVCLNDLLAGLSDDDGRTDVVISHVTSPTDFYVYLLSDTTQDEIKTLLDDSDKLVPVADVDVGDVCAAKFLDDGQWYRGKILRKLDGEFEVIFTDYGNVALSDELRQLTDELKEIPSVAKHCSLLLPDTNVQESVKEYFIQLVNQIDENDSVRCLFIEEGDLNTVSLKWNGVKLEDMLSVDVLNVTDDDSVANTTVIECFNDTNLDDDARAGGSSVSNETDEEKRSKIGINVVDTTEGFKSDDERVLESGQVQEDVVEEEEEVEVGDEHSEEEFQDADENPRSPEQVNDQDVEVNVNVDNIRTVTDKIVPGSISRGVTDEVPDEVPIIIKKQSPTEKIIPGSISRGISLEQDDEQEAEIPEQTVVEETKVEEEKIVKHNKVEHCERIVPGSVSRGSPEPIPVHAKIPKSEKLVAGVVTSNNEDQSGVVTSNNEDQHE